MKVYKFLSLHKCKEINKNTKKVIETQEVYFNDWEKMNDPMEGFYMYYPDNHEQNFETILRSEKKKYKIFCCSKEYSNILMWAHYADEYNGICVEIDVDTELCKVESIFNVNVIYRKYLQDIYPNKSVQDHAKHILKHKISKWSYEKEKDFL